MSKSPEDLEIMDLRLELATVTAERDKARANADAMRGVVNGAKDFMDATAHLIQFRTVQNEHAASLCKYQLFEKIDAYNARHGQGDKQ